MMNRIIILLALLALLPIKMFSADNNDETVVIDGVSYHVLRSSADWTRLGQLVTEADGKSDVNAILDEDFTVTEPLPSNAPFRGIFDGNGHTLYLNIDRGTNNTGALFLTTAGQDPHGIIIPGQWQWPTETTCIKEAYPDFNTWASDHTKAKDWYNNPKAGKVVKR